MGRSQPPSPGELPNPVSLVDIDVHPVTQRQAVQLVARFAEEGGPSLVVTPNVDHVVQLRRDPRLRAAYRSARLRVCDGAPLVWLARLCGQPVPERVAGADLFVDVCGEAARRELKVFVVGGAPDVLARGMAAMQRRFPDLQLDGHSPPMRFEGTEHDAEAQRRLAAADPDIVMVCLGAPRAEIWAAQQQQRHPAVYLCVGAAIDFAAGARSRAPERLQRLGLEWLYRLAQEPGRLWRRYLVQDSVFLLISVRELLRCRMRPGRRASFVRRGWINGPPGPPDRGSRR